MKLEELAIIATLLATTTGCAGNKVLIPFRAIVPEPVYRGTFKDSNRPTRFNISTIGYLAAIEHIPYQLTPKK